MQKIITQLFSVLIPNWNGRCHLKECLDSVAKQTFQDFEIIMVDNGSSDESAQYAHEICPTAKILELQKNIGFAAGVNRGIEVAQGEYIVLLNNDTVVDPYWLENLSRAVCDNPDGWIFASKLLNYYNRNIIDSA